MAVELFLLLAEDEPLIREDVRHGLTEVGFAVVTANNGNDAIRELEASPARFRAVITDIRLGAGPNGWDVAHRARELVPDIAIVYMSGDSVADWSANGVPKSIMVAKPFVLAQLVTAVSNLLNETDSHLGGGK